MKKIYKIIFILIYNSTFLIYNTFSQTAPGIEWQNTIGGSKAELISSIIQTTDGGYFLGGFSNSDISGDKTENNVDTTLNTYDYWVVKTDATGNIQWQNTIGGVNTDVIMSSRQTSDKGYILGGRSDSNISGDKTENSNGGFDYWIVKIDSMGNVQWQNTIGGNGDEYFFDLKETTDGGYILGGSSISDISGDKTENHLGQYDYWIVKTDSLGNIQWQNTIGGSKNDNLTSIEQTKDGGYILGGFSESNISGDKTENNMGGLYTNDYWVVKTDSLGNIQWQNTIGGSYYDLLFSIEQTTDKGFILAGESVSGASGDKTENNWDSTEQTGDYWLVKTDSLGNIQWQNTIGGSDDDIALSAHQTADGGYVIAGPSVSDISGDKTENNLGAPATFDYWIVKTDSAGNVQWDNTIGGAGNDQLGGVQQTNDGGYILGGFSDSNISGDKTENNVDTICIPLCSSDYWIVKLGPDTITGIPTHHSSLITHNFSPNPLTTQSKLTFKNPNKEKYLFILYDITGRVTETVSTASNEIILTKGSKQPGVYLFNLVNEKTGERWSGKALITN
ncbi:MAG TPA: T9SS type A sorting domain-containing protein [Bacteroidia bacterium]|nr:T9SS type A sorting domain-containing protein [Bacteroidia bacterium]